ncbi:Uncharacterized protein OBRU01_05370 [Operophtera brumata]|uniref:RGS domain-containing protein n=1 Tax=Operophtera brumata TaxID=104452 RepID=A0A0L7LMM1_OPEBR|nr:Uncharacterized protein OBRU01_05370 [Operophtera brumata]
MDNCFAACGCDEFGISKSDLDRFTDKIENVLHDEKGRKLFRSFMFTSKMKHGRKTLDFLEHVERLLGYREDEEGVPFRNFLGDIDNLMDEADRIDELDFALMERLTTARSSENIEGIMESLKLVKVEVTGALRREYSAFRAHFIKFKQ